MGAVIPARPVARSADETPVVVKVSAEASVVIEVAACRSKIWTNDGAAEGLPAEMGPAKAASEVGATKAATEVSAAEVGAAEAAAHMAAGKAASHMPAAERRGLPNIVHTPSDDWGNLRMTASIRPSFERDLRAHGCEPWAGRSTARYAKHWDDLKE
jgi:hypothetical protein